MKPFLPIAAVAGASLLLTSPLPVTSWVGPFSRSSASSQAAPPPIVICPGTLLLKVKIIFCMLEEESWVEEAAASLLLQPPLPPSHRPPHSGFGNDQIDYLNPMNLGEEAGMVQALRRRGFPVYVVPVKRTDWLKVLGRDGGRSSGGGGRKSWQLFWRPCFHH